MFTSSFRVKSYVWITSFVLCDTDGYNHRDQRRFPNEYLAMQIMSIVRKYQPHYFVSDYQQWEGEWELWFGTAVSMSPSPFGPHERAIAKFVAQIDASITKDGCACAVYAGLDWIVQENTVVRPDVMLVCGTQPTRYLESPPSLTIEVLSESTATKDLHAKRELYEEQKVEHYLIVDTAELSIQWLALQSNGKFSDQSDSIANDGKFSIELRNGCVVHFDRNAAFFVMAF